MLEPILATSARYPDLPLSTLSAARMLGVPVVLCPRMSPEVTVVPRSNAHLPGVHPYRARLREHDTVVLDGRLLTSPARTVIDIARHHPFVTAVAAIDYVLHEQLASAEGVLDAFMFCERWPGAKRARRALLECDSRAESPLESISRLVIPRRGLPTPEPQMMIYDQDGRFLGRCDFCWEEWGVVGEADGRQKYTDVSVLTAEKDRESGLRDAELEIARWYWEHAVAQQQVLRRRVLDAEERRRRRTLAGAPRPWIAVPTDRIAVLS